MLAATAVCCYLFWLMAMLAAEPPVWAAAEEQTIWYVHFLWE